LTLSAVRIVFLLPFFMNRWIPYAFVRIVLFFMLGICVSIYYPDLVDERLGKLICLSAFFIYVILAFKLLRKSVSERASKLKVYAGVVGLIAIFFAGVVRVPSNTESNNFNHIANVDSIKFFTVVITTSAIEKQNSWKIEAEVQNVNSNGSWKKGSGKVMLYQSKKDFPSPVKYGELLLINGNPQLVPPPSNPEEFDYRRFLAYKNIYHQKFIRRDDVRQIGFAPPSSVDFYALQTRQWADKTIKQHVSGDREKGLASALVLGVTDGLDNDLLSAYKATGTLHVLAVSGLHVGILYGLVLWILTPLNKLSGGPWIIAGISIVVLWCYAFVTGLSPSVLRAVTMFSFVAFAKPGGHRTNIYNTLAASAFFILWYDPFFIMSVGFQLSYLAVLGIVYIQPGLYNLFNPTNRILDEIWKISTVSIAAQIATFSLGLFYFHQFPNYFLVSNLVAIPGSFVVLIIGLAILATAFLSHVAMALGFVLEWVIKGMNAVMFMLEDLPFSLVENVYITATQCWALISILLAVILLLHTRKFTWVKVAFLFGIIFSGLQWYHYTAEINIRKMTVYNITGHTAVDLIENGQIFFIADSSLRSEPQKVAFHMGANRIKSGGQKVYTSIKTREDRNGCSLIVWNKKAVVHIYKSGFRLPEKLNADFVIVSNNSIRNVDELLKHISVKNLILDSSNSKHHSSNLMQQNMQTATKIYSVVHQGAFELKL
jgi:competence protein ComEC